MKSAYPALLSPIKRRNFTLKNRMVSANSQPHFHQGPEKYPADGTFAHFIERARNGAAIVTFSGINDVFGEMDLPASLDVAHFPHYDAYDARCQNYITQLFDAMHYYGSLASVGLFAAFGIFPYFHPDGTLEEVNIHPSPDSGELIMEQGTITDAITEEMLEKIAASFAQQSVLVKKFGADMVTLHMCYRGQSCGQFLSPRMNFRTDQYGGSAKNRARFPVMVLGAIREAVGNDFLIEIEVSGDEPDGSTIEDTLTFLKLAEPYIDIVQVRCGEPSPSMPTSFYLEKNPALHLAEEIKAAGLDLLIEAIGGWLDPDDAEKVIKEGKADLIGMARAFISNPDYGQLVHEGRRDDIVPCLRCNKCHGRGPNDVMLSTCSVNPVFGIEHRARMLAAEPGEKKNIAVIGGGPCGMRTAIYLFDRGHKVTIYEKEAAFGGLLRHADHVDFKWTIKDYKNYLINQVEKRDIEIKLNIKVTPDTLGDDYDVVIAAVGSESACPPIPGVDGKNVKFAFDAIMEQESVGKNVIVIGGGEVGVETGMFLAKGGRNVVVLEMRDQIAADAAWMHYRDQLEAAYGSIPTLSCIVNATARKITEQGVTYCDADGKEHTLAADTIVVSAGMKAKKEEALSFYNTGKLFYMVGDCHKPGTVQTGNRSAYAVASII